MKIVQHARFVYGCRNCEKHGIEVPIKTAKAPCPVIEKGLNPYAYLNNLFEKLPNLESRDDATLDQLLPWNVKLQ